MYGTLLAEKLTNAIQNVKILTAKMGFKTGAGKT
jgi:hypothetical protein